MTTTARRRRHATHPIALEIGKLGSKPISGQHLRVELMLSGKLMSLFVMGQRSLAFGEVVATRLVKRQVRLTGFFG